MGLKAANLRYLVQKRKTGRTVLVLTVLKDNVVFNFDACLHRSVSK